MGKVFRITCMMGLAAHAALCATLTIDPGRTIHEVRRGHLVGSNIALWNQPWELPDEDLLRYVRDLAPAYIRIPGGSWANHYIWNGNGARLGEDRYDLSRLSNGVWNIDWSGYAPGFSIEGDERLPVADGFHGSWHVEELHRFVESFGARPVVTVNLGTGTPEMAAEWVRWANIKNKFGVTYWELGNELEGAWELGHILPDGRVMTGEIFAERFAEFARAMKAVDPSIKTGGPASSNTRGAFIRELLRDQGDLVDFISFHAYPVENRVQQESDFFQAVRELPAAVERIRRLIDQYQPDRKDVIKVAVTEWNSKVVEDRATADLRNGLWSAMWVGEMFRSGVSFANQWDMMTATETGGHGLFYFDQFDFEQPGVPQEEMDRQFQSFDPPCIPKGQYWALYLWSRYMGDRLVYSELKDADGLYAAVTGSDETLQVMLINTSRTDVKDVTLMSQKALANHGMAVRLSHNEYFWNPYTHAPQWSRRPEAVKIRLARDRTLSVPPFSMLVVQVPLAGGGQEPVAPADPLPPCRTDIELLLPAAVPEDIPVEGWVLMPGSGAYTTDAAPITAVLDISGPATLDRTAVRMNEGAGRFSIQPTGTGKVKLEVRCGGKKAAAEINIEKVTARNEVLWRFEGEQGLEGIHSDFNLSLSDTAKPNQQTAAIGVKDVSPKEGRNLLMAFNMFPDDVPKERVGGVVFDICGSRELAESAPDARLAVVLQSSADHWIPIGSVPLRGLGEAWQTVSLPIENHEQLGSMKWLYCIRFQLEGDGPVNGEIYIDDAGVILR